MAFVSAFIEAAKGGIKARDERIAALERQVEDGGKALVSARATITSLESLAADKDAEIAALRERIAGSEAALREFAAEAGFRIDEAEASEAAQSGDGSENSAQAG